MELDWKTRPSYAALKLWNLQNREGNGVMASEGW